MLKYANSFHKIQQIEGTVFINWIHGVGTEVSFVGCVWKSVFTGLLLLIWTVPCLLRMWPVIWLVTLVTSFSSLSSGWRCRLSSCLGALCHFLPLCPLLSFSVPPTSLPSATTGISPSLYPLPLCSPRSFFPLLHVRGEVVLDTFPAPGSDPLLTSWVLCSPL